MPGELLKFRLLNQMDFPCTKWPRNTLACQKEKLKMVRSKTDKYENLFTKKVNYDIRPTFSKIINHRLHDGSKITNFRYLIDATDSRLLL